MTLVITAGDIIKHLEGALTKQQEGMPHDAFNSPYERRLKILQAIGVVGPGGILTTSQHATLVTPKRQGYLDSALL
eukprot:1998644-Pyramimonas_sp.AAC.1